MDQREYQFLQLLAGFSKSLGVAITDLSARPRSRHEADAMSEDHVRLEYNSHLSSRELSGARLAPCRGSFVVATVGDCQRRDVDPRSEVLSAVGRRARDQERCSLLALVRALRDICDKKQSRTDDDFCIGTDCSDLSSNLHLYV